MGKVQSGRSRARPKWLAEVLGVSRAGWSWLGAGARNGARSPTDSSRSQPISISRKPLETVLHVVQRDLRLGLRNRRSQVRILSGAFLCGSGRCRASNIGPHECRHSYVTHLRAAGVNDAGSPRSQGTESRRCFPDTRMRWALAMGGRSVIG